MATGPRISAGTDKCPRPTSAKSGRTISCRLDVVDEIAGSNRSTASPTAFQHPAQSSGRAAESAHAHSITERAGYRAAVAKLAL
jgi:hypothetical protein